MSHLLTVSGNYALRAEPRNRWNNWCETVPVATADAEGLDYATMFAALELMREVSTDGQAHMADGMPIGCVHLDEVDWYHDLNRTVLPRDEYGYLARNEQQTAGDAAYEFTVCGTLENFERTTQLVNAAGPWDAYFLVIDSIEGQGRSLYLSAVHPGFREPFGNDQWADPASKSEQQMALHAQENWSPL